MKLELGGKQLKRISKSKALRKLSGRPGRKVSMRSTYFDTPDCALHAAGISFRIRKADGKLKQTVKVGTGIHGGISNPVEVECVVKKSSPDIRKISDRGLRIQIRKLVSGKKLRPVFKTDILRRVHRIKRSGAKAELALDKGRVATAKRSAPIYEAELELVSGDAHALLPMAQKLFARYPVRFATLSKAERGYRLVSAAQQGETNKGAVKAVQPELKPAHAVTEAFQLCCRSATDQILGNWYAVLADDDPESVHQLRIGLRRLRTALKLFRPAIDSLALRKLAVDLRDAGRIVGELRDCDVMLADIARPASAAQQSKAGPRAIEKLLVRRCRKRRKKVRRDLLTKRWNKMLLHLALLPHGAGWQIEDSSGQAVELARQALDRCWKHVLKRADKLDRLSIEERHHLRKDLKTLRYATEFFKSIFAGEDVEHFIVALKRLQDGFGYLNDVALANTLPDIFDARPKTAASTRQSVGFILGWHAAIAEHEWRDVKDRWLNLNSRPKFWH
ncbi:MAG: CHAD domain-containing protein [Rhizobiaceae bacterium]